MSHDDMMGCIRTEAANPAVVSDHYCPCDRIKPSERLKTWLRNLWHWRTAWAVRYLSKQLQKDKAFRDSWQANIATTIFDTSSSNIDGHGAVHHKSDWSIAIGVGRKQCNEIADRLMKHLFNA